MSKNSSRYLISKLKNSLSPHFKHRLWLARRFHKKIRFRGNNRYCPICENSFSMFESFGVKNRKDVCCPYCASLERHRLYLLFFQRKTNLFKPPIKKMLHVAPEPSFGVIFNKSKNINYLSADLYDQSVMVKMDITDIQYPDNSFDVIFCSHVLEHVMDDKKAMKEFLRVLKPSGWAVLQVPIMAKKTIEDPTITDPRERLRVFGQHDHVRRYGRDYKDRLREVGFKVQVVKAGDVASEPEIKKMRLGSEIYYCTNP